MDELRIWKDLPTHPLTGRSASQSNALRLILACIMFIVDDLAPAQLSIAEKGQLQIAIHRSRGRRAEIHVVEIHVVAI